MSFVSHGANVCHTQGGMVLAGRLILGSTSSVPSPISFSHVWEKYVFNGAGSLSLSPPPSLYLFLKDLGLFTILGPTERLLLNHRRCQDSWPPEKKNSIQGQKRGLITQSFCVIKFYSSIKEIEKASEIDIRRGQKERPLIVFRRMVYGY